METPKQKRAARPTSGISKPKKASVSLTPLDPDEWNFEWVPPDLARSVFLYEYFRSSKKLSELVRWGRIHSSPPERIMSRAWKFSEKIIEASQVEWLHLSPAGVQKIHEETRSGAALVRLVNNLMNCPPFPDVPALKLADRDWLRQLDPEKAVWDCPGINAKTGRTLDQVLDQDLSQPGIEYRFDGSYVAKGHESVFPLVVDWRKPDAQMEKEFREQVLNRRPEQFWQDSKLPPSQSAFWSSVDKLPFTLETALEWLGVWRRFQAAGGRWGTYLDRFETSQKRQQIELGEREKHKAKFDNWKRQRKKECKNARMITAWLESGARRKLTRNDFR